jgi:tripartite-type tricarboxylate transporter receptor subunit TctC
LSRSLLFAALLAPVHAAFAAWPDKPIRLIVPSAAGGAPDVLMRAMSAQLSRQLGVPIVIDNSGGGAR